MTQLIERTAVRLLVLDANEDVLLLHTRDLSDANFGSAWELPGGGIEPGESFVAAALRELYEETGLQLTTDQIAAPTWHRDVIYSYRGERRLQHEAIAVARLDDVAPLIVTSARVAFEAEDHFEYRWWQREEIVAAGVRFFPKSLPQQVGRVMAGERVTEPVEVWP